jgi:uncharacterized lipoprotein YmbA
MIIMLVIVFATLVLGGCSSESAKRARQQNNELAMIKEAKQFIPLSDITAVSHSEQYNMMSFLLEEKQYDIVYKHNEVWSAWHPVPVGTNAKLVDKRDSLIGYYIPIRLIK